MRILIIMLSLTGLLPLSAVAQLKWENLEVEVPATVTDTEVKGEFLFINEGTYPVTIRNITTSCGCTTGQADKKIYAPGEKGTLKSVMQVGNHRGRTTKTITVMTDDDKAPKAVLSIHGLLPELVKMEPEELRLKKGDPNKTQTISIKIVHDKPLHLTGVKSFSDQIHPSLETIKEGQEYVLTVTFAKTTETLGTPVHLETDIIVGGEKKIIPFNIYVD